MKKRNLLVSLAAMSILMSALVGCNKPAEESSKSEPKSQPSTNQPAPSTSAAPASTSSKAPAVPTPDASQALVTQVATPDQDGKGETIT